MLKKVDNSIRKTVASSIETAKPYLESNWCIRVAYIIFAILVVATVVIVYLLVIAPMNSSQYHGGGSNFIQPSSSPTSIKLPSTNPIGFYHTSGNQMVDIYGKSARISSVNW